MENLRTINYSINFLSVPDEPDEDAKPKQAPLFVSKPEAVEVEEGEWARFCARVTGHPRPRVMWLINGHTVVNVRLISFTSLTILSPFKYFMHPAYTIFIPQGSRYKLTYDGMYHFDIPKTRQYDTGKIEVVARSSVGEALATTTLKVVQRKDDYRGVLKNSPRRKCLTATYKNSNEIKQNNLKLWPIYKHQIHNYTHLLPPPYTCNINIYKFFTAQFTDTMFSTRNLLIQFHTQYLRSI